MSSNELEEEEVYADYARKNLAQRVLEAPSLYLAQSLVMISFYEWGTGRPYQAWMYSGTHQSCNWDQGTLADKYQAWQHT